MASRRMFSKDVVCSDRFLDMPASAQALYFQYGLEADDDGFVSAPKKILRLTNASDDDLKILVAKGFLIPFDSGVVVIRDWKINNYLRRDRYTPTRFKEEFEQLDTIQCVYWVISVLPRGVAALWGIYFPFVMKFFAIYGYMSGFYWLFTYFPHF